MEKLNENDFEVLDKCPWCLNDFSTSPDLYVDEFGCNIKRCGSCGVVFAVKRLNKFGREKFWSDYSSRIHTVDNKMLEKRKLMYRMDFDFIKRHLPSTGKVLDVGCGEGDFLSLFKESGYITAGCEFGREAAEIASKKHNVFKGNFPDLDIPEKYDLIIFRGVLQYVDNPKLYLDKAISLLSERGIIYITAQPNMDSFCFSLFGKKFPNAPTCSDFIQYSESVFDKYFTDKKLKKIDHAFFYEKTPYADLENDILNVARAIECKRSGKSIDFNAPAFWGNVMTIAYCK